MSLVGKRQAARLDGSHYVRNADGELQHRDGYCTLTDTYYGPPETFGTHRIMPDGWLLIALVLGVLLGLATLDLVVVPR